MTKGIPLLIASVLYRYEPETGAIYLKSNGKKIGWNNSRGYEHITMTCENQRVGNFRSNRLGWAIHTGIDPGDYEIDHENRDRNDNRIVNLRPVTRKENRLNQTNVSEAYRDISELLVGLARLT